VESMTVTAPNISCAHCKSSIERELGSMSGVDACRVDIDSKQVRVTYDPARISSGQIVERLDQEGYPVAG
jgi:copper chaperone